MAVGDDHMISRLGLHNRPYRHGVTFGLTGAASVMTSTGVTFGVRSVASACRIHRRQGHRHLTGGHHAGEDRRPGDTTRASPTGRSPVASEGMLITVPCTTIVVEPPPS